MGTAKIKGSVRFGIGPFNTDDDIQAAVTSVAAIAAMRIGAAGVSMPAPDINRP
jgi:cysteine sulfinate desulfinase/cysteine desulfurase-like protein